MKVGIVGFGGAGGVHFAANQEVEEFDVVAVCDPSPERRTSAATLGVHAYVSVQELLSLEELDAVIISTPPSDHVATTLACLSRGIHVLCEKPLALATPAAQAMFDAANSHTRLAVASKFRHVDALQRVRELLRSGELGDPHGFHVSFCGRVDMSTRWNSQPSLSGGGVIADNASHVFDIVMYLFGALASVKAIAQPSAQPIPVEDSAYLQIETVGGIMGTAEITWSRPASSDSYVTITGSRTRVAIGWQQSLLARSDGSCETFGSAYSKVAAHSAMHRAFRDAIRGHGELWMQRDECLAAVAAVEASYRSLRSGFSEALNTMARPLPAVSSSVAAA